MFSKQPATELITKRRSCRSFTGHALNDDVRIKMNEFLAQNSKGVFGSTIRLSLVATTPNDQDILKGLGTYGFIKGASAFIVGAVEKSETDLEDYGYVMEKCILHATALGLGSCWLGGSFSKSSFASRISCKENETVPAVAALGYRADKTRLFDSTLRMLAGSSKRKDPCELFFNSDFSHPLELHMDPYTRALEMVRLAPSASNKQPWRMVREKNTDVFHLFLQRTKGYHENNSKWFGLMDMQRVDMGIAMSHFELACREEGVEGGWTELKPGNPKIAAIPELTQYVATWTKS